MLPLSYAAGSAFPTDVLPDGRILFESGFPLGSGHDPEMFLVYSDGSGVESYRCDHGGRAGAGRSWLRAMWCSRTELPWRASLRRWRTKQRVAAPQAEYAGAIAETASGEWLVSARTRCDGALCDQDLEAGRAQRSETVLAEDRRRPCRARAGCASDSQEASFGLAPWDYANLLALDARLSREGD